MSPARAAGVAAVVLAAGASRRMGRPKMLLPLGPAGPTLLRAAVLPVLEAGLEEVVVVLGPAAEEVARAAGLGEEGRVRVVVNPAWEEGLASSLRRGVSAVGPSAAAVLLVLGDQPGLTAARVRRIVQAWDGRAPLVAPVADGRTGHPVLFARAVFPELLALAGDVGARTVVRRHAAAGVLVPLPHLADVDTEDDYRRVAHPSGSS